MPGEEATSRRGLAATAIAAALIAAALFGYLAWLRPSQAHLWGDEGTYLAMTASLARDLDLEFQEADRVWAEQRGGDKGVSLILQRSERGVTYSKPPLYPLLAAIPYKLFGELGMVATNVVVLAAALLLGWALVRRLGSVEHALLTLVAFAGVAAIAPYLLWRMSEALQFALALAGLTLACGSLRAAPDSSRREGAPTGVTQRLGNWLDHQAAPYVGGALLGLLTSMRTSNALLLVGAAVACLWVGGRRRALAVGAGAAIALACAIAFSTWSLGAANPYTAQRSSFNGETGYPAGAQAEAALERFDARPATHRVRFAPSGVSLYSALYFLIGRHTGLLAYFPVALALMAALLWRPDRVGLTMLATTIGLAVFYLIYMPHNYFGGSTFVGNRYFLVAYPALLVGLRRLPSPRLLVAALAIGLVFGGSAVASVRATRELDQSSQSHAAAGAFLRLPHESTAREIQGQKARFWAQDFTRFTTPFAEVERNRFRLRSDRPFTEMMIVNRRPSERLVFLVQPAQLLESIDWTDWRRDGWTPLIQKDRARPGVVTLFPSRPWRNHRFWWRGDEAHQARVLRMRLRSGDDGAQTADVYYLGKSWDLLSSGRAATVSSDLPVEADAGGSAIARVVVRNQSPVTWSPTSVLPVVLGYRVEGAAGVATRGRAPLSAVVRRGEEVELEIEIDWPQTAGRYELIVDLALHPLYWFGDLSGEPVARGTVDVR